MKYLKLISIFLFAYLINSSFLTASESIRERSILIGHEHEIDSKVLQEKRQYLVRLPQSYQTSKRQYPVIYILDSNNHFQHAVSATKILNDYNRMPEVILVGILNNPGSRFRDLSEKSDNFLQFIEGELVPHINKNYRTLDYNTLFGHSLAGFFALNTLAKNHNIFQNYIAASPHLLANQGEIESNLMMAFDNKSLNNYRAYFSMADELGDGKERVESLNKLIEFLSNHTSPALIWKHQPVDMQVHMTTPYLTLYKGLTYLYKDFQMPRFINYENFLQQGGMKSIENYYKNRGVKYMQDKQVPQAVFRSVARLLVENSDIQSAITLLKQSAEKKPGSIRAKLDLARLYQRNGEKNLALQAYISARSLLTPDNNDFSGFITRQIKILSTKENHKNSASDNS